MIRPLLWPALLLGLIVSPGLPAAPVSPDRDIAAGRKLFLMNCAHCHGADASGDEGPDLHDLRKTDERITTIIKGGIKGEMPRFNAKLSDADVKTLVAYLRSLH